MGAPVGGRGYLLRVGVPAEKGHVALEGVTPGGNKRAHQSPRESYLTQGCELRMVGRAVDWSMLAQG